MPASFPLIVQLNLGAEIWASVPRVSPRGLGRFQVEWGSTDLPADSRGFVIEYRFANDTK